MRWLGVLPVLPVGGTDFLTWKSKRHVLAHTCTLASMCATRQHIVWRATNVPGNLDHVVIVSLLACMHVCLAYVVCISMHACRS
jgi:hypothetical protein